MKIMYICQTEADIKSGVFKKILEQCAEWEENNEVRLIIFSPENKVADLDMVKKFKIEVIVYESLIEKAFLMLTLLHKFLSFKPDLIYFRYGTYHPIFEIVFRMRPVIIEINSKHIEEQAITLKKWKFIYHKITYHRLLKLASGMVAVTNELLSDYSSSQVSSIAIGNGIDLKRVPLLKPNIELQNRLAFMGSSGCSWHGVDELPYLAEKLPDYEIHIIGYDESDFNFIPSNLIVHGKMKDKEYLSILEKCDIAIASLALYRKNMYEGSSLKLREYLALGLPCVSGHGDIDFPVSVDYILEIPNSPGAIRDHIEEIKLFLMNWKGKRVDRSSISRLDIKIKEKQRLKFFQDSINRWK
jgi:hypothetical protein